MDITIRRATIWDAVEITKLYEKLAKETPVLMCNTSEKELERFFINIQIRIKGEGLVRVLEDENNKMVGFMSGYTYIREYGSSHVIAFCDNIYIEPEHRGFALLNDLCNHAVMGAQKIGAKEIQFNLPYDAQSHQLLRKRQGYKASLIVYSKEVS